MLYKEIPKRTKNALVARIKQAVERYCFTEFRAVAIRYINENVAEQKLKRTIAEKEKELKELRG